MFKKWMLFPGWMVVTCLTLFLALNNYQEISFEAEKVRASEPKSEVVLPNLLYASLPNSTDNIKTEIFVADARPEIIRQYLAKYDSPLLPYSDMLVRVADENGFDFRWMVAIAQQESNLCKKIPENSYNCWGWGIYGDKVTRFASYEDAIRRIAPQLKDKFLVKTLDPHQVMETYTPPSDGSWAFGVKQFMAEME